ncbi:hypothetical protein [Variovorax paradoxus]|uniref:hypothetical protein n=1 Tax=Variovorax paradoxus TaxID=34073 RepID=UPI0027D7A745|nr:hypothetical protein [Variovorax paradoxus]
MRAANAAKRRKAPPVETPEALALRLIDAARPYAAIWHLPVTITPDHLLPWPAVCVYTLDDLIEGDSPQQPILARLVDSEGFTPENTVIISARARRRHQAIGGTAIRKHAENADRLPGLTEHLVRESVRRYNLLTWADDAVRAAEAWNYQGAPKTPRASPATDDTTASTHWQELIDGKPADWLPWARSDSLCVSLTALEFA